MLEVLNALMTREEFLREAEAAERHETRRIQSDNREEARPAGNPLPAGTAEEKL